MEMVWEDIPELTAEEQRAGWHLVRHCDALDVLEMALDAFERDQDEYSERDIENARDELRILRESASTQLLWFKRLHGFPENR